MSASIEYTLPPLTDPVETLADLASLANDPEPVMIDRAELMAVWHLVNEVKSLREEAFEARGEVRHWQEEHDRLLHVVFKQDDYIEELRHTIRSLCGGVYAGADTLRLTGSLNGPSGVSW